MIKADHNACPCCGQPWDESGPKAEAIRVLFPLVDHLTVQRARLLKHLLGNFGEWTSRKKMADALYADDPHGGPDGSENVVASQLTKLRREIEPYGFEIEGRPFFGSRLKRLSNPGMPA